MRANNRSSPAFWVRPASVADCQVLASVQVESYRSAYAGLLPPVYLAHLTYEEQEEDWHSLLTSPTEQMLLVAEGVGEGVLGYALSEPTLEGGHGYEAELLALHVRRTHQRQGVGTQLVAVTASALHGRGRSSIGLWVLERNSARRFYEKLGGAEIGRRPWVNNACFGTEVLEVEYAWPDITLLCQAAERRTQARRSRD
jgi:ribosomal protein S18 acetylase RimI-like enzyme